MQYKTGMCLSMFHLLENFYILMSFLLQFLPFLFATL